MKKVLITIFRDSFKLLKQYYSSQVILYFLSIFDQQQTMIRLFHRQLSFFSKLNIDNFQRKDFQTMCQLLKEKHPVYNEAIQVKSDVKLLDENGKLVGRYQASEARRKAFNLRKDIVLINMSSNPVICKLLPFRQKILNSFYDQIVVKRNEQLIKKASSTKHLKISLKLSDNDLVIKSKQIIELAKKNLNVRIYVNCKLSQVDEAYAKLDSVKAMLQNKCTIEKDMSVTKEDDEEETPKNYDKQEQEPRRTVSIVVKSKSNQFLNMIQENSEKDPESVIQSFLKRYYKQQDVDMMDLKAKVSEQTNQFLQSLKFGTEEKKEVKAIPKTKTKKSAVAEQEKKQKKIIETEQQKKFFKLFQKHKKDDIKCFAVAKTMSKNRMLSERLRAILETEVK